MQNKIIFDFDKTIISENSFPLWIRFLIYRSIKSLAIGKLAKISLLLFRRKVLNTIDHNELKHNLITMPTPAQWDEAFAKAVLKHSRPSVVRQILQHLDAGELIVISSAAPYKYLSKTVSLLFPDRFGQVVTLGADIELGKLNDNYKENKLSNIYRRGIINNAEKIKAFYTDSWDDRFLAAAAERVFLVHPPRADLEKFMADPSLNVKISIFNH